MEAEVAWMNSVVNHDRTVGVATVIHNMWIHRAANKGCLIIYYASSVDETVNIYLMAINISSMASSSRP